MGAAQSEVPIPRTYGNWRRPSTPGLFGLGSAGTGMLFAGLVVFVLVIVLGGPLRGLITLVLVAGGVLLVTWRDKHHRNRIDRLVARVSWITGTQGRQHVYRGGPVGGTPWRTFQLPGVAAPLQVAPGQDSYGQEFAVVASPSTGTYTVVISCEPDGAVLVDEHELDVWVARWGQWLSNLGEEPGIVAASVVVETAPDTGDDLRRQVTARLDPSAPAFAREVMQEVVRTYPSGSRPSHTYVTITVRGTTDAGRKRTPDEVRRDLGARMPSLVDSLARTGAGGCQLVNVTDLAAAVRLAFAPELASVIDEARHTNTLADAVHWYDIGPAAAEPTWDRYYHDQSVSMTWAMSVPPRMDVQATVLARMLAPVPGTSRKRVTLLYQPIEPARAAALVEADLSAAVRNAEAQRTPSSRSLREAQAAAATAQEEAAGAGLQNFGLLITATVPRASDLSDLRASVDGLAAATRIRLRPVYGSQDSAFLAALPLGIQLPELSTMPSILREKL